MFSMFCKAKPMLDIYQCNGYAMMMAPSSAIKRLAYTNLLSFVSAVKSNIWVMTSKQRTVMWLSISLASDDEQSQNKHTASNPEGPVHSDQSLQRNITN